MKIAKFIELASKIAGKKSPSTFLAENDAFLRTFPKCTAILEKLAAGKLLPTPAMALVLLTVSRETDVRASRSPGPTPKVGAPKVGVPKKASPPKAEKRYTVILSAHNGWKIGEVFSADAFGEAEKKACNRVYAGGSDTFAEIIGDGITTKVTFAAAAAHVFAKPLGGKQSCLTVVTSGKMQSVKSSVATFSGG